MSMRYLRGCYGCYYRSSEGPKTDKIDASKLVQLLKADLLKEVYHSTNKFLYLRRLVSGYDDLIKAGVRLKTQKYSLLRVCGKNGYEKGTVKLLSMNEEFVLNGLNRQIASYEEEKKGYEKEFRKLAQKHQEIRQQKSLPGIGDIHAVKIVARVVTPWRFANKGHYLSYAGLVKLVKVSGGRRYGNKNSRYCRQLKNVYKTGVMAAIGGNNPLNDYYDYLINEEGCQPHIARHKACRRLAVLSYGVFKSGKTYQPYARELKTVNN